MVDREAFSAFGDDVIKVDLPLLRDELALILVNYLKDDLLNVPCRPLRQLREHELIIPASLEYIRLLH